MDKALAFLCPCVLSLIPSSSSLSDETKQWPCLHMTLAVGGTLITNSLTLLICLGMAYFAKNMESLVWTRSDCSVFIAFASIIKSQFIVYFIILPEMAYYYAGLASVDKI